MYSDKDFKQFIYNALHVKNADLGKYSDAEFYEQLRTYSLKNIKEILCTINIINLNCAAERKLFYLTDNINVKHAISELRCLDFCLVAGLDELATRFSALGAKPSAALDIFAHNVSRIEADLETGCSLNTISTCIKAIDLGKKINSNYPIDNKPQKSVYDYFKVLYKHKYTALLFVLGMLCVICAPLTGVVNIQSLLLLSIGLPAVLASIGSMQSARTASANYTQVEDQSRIAYEIKEMHHIYKLVNTMIIFVDNPNAKHFANRHEINFIDVRVNKKTNSLLFADNRRNDEDTENLKSKLLLTKP